MTDVKVKVGQYVTIEDYKGEIPEGKAFVAWNTSEDGTGAVFKPGKKVRMVEDMRLYPMWRDVSE